MKRWSSSLRFALEHTVAQSALAAALFVPLVATVGQYWSSGYWSQSARVTLLFWPGVDWTWAVKMPVWLSMGTMLASYAVGIAWLARRRALAPVALSALAALIVANLAAAPLNYLAGWRELQTMSSMALAGKANRLIFAQWHNPVWEELVFRGVPLLLLLAARKALGRDARWSVRAYYLVPAVVFAIYHVPGHGPSRLVDTFILSLVFSWMTLRYSFFAPLVMHYVFDAVSTLSLGRMSGIPATEVAWLAEHFTVLNSTWTILMMLWLASIATVVLVRRYGAARAPVAVSQ
jgi:Type II CAAX prenyl endopeptidase Rce1-like